MGSHRRSTPAYMAQRRKLRLEYMDLWVQKETTDETVLPSEVKDKLAELERILTFEDIRFFRCVPVFCVCACLGVYVPPL